MIPFSDMVVSRAHRILYSLESFNPSSENPPPVAISDDETFIGSLRGARTGYQQLLVTDLAVYGVAQDSTVRIPYARIIGAALKGPEVVDSSPSTFKSDADVLAITLTTGQKVNLPVSGNKGRFRDIFEFLRFINRVVSDYEKRLPWWKRSWRRWRRFRVEHS